MWKKLVVLLVVVSMFATCIPAVYAEGEGINVVVDGNKLTFDVPPFLDNGRMLVPVRAIFEALDATIEWDGNTQTVTASKGDKIITLQIGNDKATIGNTEVILDVPAKLKDGRTFVPVRFVSEALGAKVVWDSATNTAFIDYETLGRGNSTGNIANYGSVAQQGDWIFYSYRDDGLFKIKNDGSAKQKLLDGNVNELNVLGEWVYFVLSEPVDEKYKRMGIYRIKTDGTQQQKISDDAGICVNIVDGWIYYINEDDLSSFYKMRLDGSLRQKVHPHAMKFLTVVDGWAYFENGSEHYDLYKMKVDGNELHKLSEGNADYINVVDGWIYYASNEPDFGLYKITINGTGKQKMYDGVVSHINVKDGWIYFSHDETIYKLRTDGSDLTPLCERTDSLSLGVAGDKVYIKQITFDYKKFTYEGLYSFNVNGGEKRRLCPGEGPDVTLSIQGDEVTYTDLPMPLNGEILLPLHEFLEHIGIENNKKHIDWDEKENSITISKDDVTIELNIDSSVAYVNNTSVDLKDTPVLYHEKVYIPAKFVLETFGKKVGSGSSSVYTVKDDEEYEKVKGILEKVHKAMKKVTKYKLAQNIKVEVANSSMTAAIEIRSSSQIDRKKEIAFISSGMTSTLNHSGDSVQTDIWVEDHMQYVRQDPGNEWISFELQDESQKYKRIFDVYEFLTPEDDALCTGLGAEMSKNKREWILKGKMVPISLIEASLQNTNMGIDSIKNAFTEIHIDKSKYYVKELIVYAEFVSNGITTKLSSTWENSDINHNFKIKRPESISQATGSVNEETQKTITEGDKLLNEGKYQAAIEKYDEAIEIDDEAADAYMGKGIALYYAGKPQEALDSFNEYLKIKPENEDALLWKANVYMYYIEDYDKAIELCDDIISNKPRSYKAYNTRGMSYFYQYQYEEALQDFNKAIDLNNQYDIAYINKIGTLYYMKDYLACIEAGQKARKLFPNNPDIPYFIANCYVEQYKNEEAIEEYKRVLDLVPEDDYVAAQIGWLYYGLQDYEGAAEYAKKALEINQDNASAQNLQQELEKTELPQAERIVAFMRENYLYYNELTDFETLSEAFTSKNGVEIEDIHEYINAVKKEDDMFTYVISGDAYEWLADFKESNQVSYKQLENGVEYIRIGSFTSSVASEFKDILDGIEQPENKILAIDLRDNGGGLTKVSNEILDYLLPECATSFTIDRRGYLYPYYSGESYVKFKKIVIMVNEHSASSSELLTLALKKYLNNVTIIGHPTVGKGVGQVVYEDKARKYMIYVVNHHWNVKEQNISGSHIQPDVVVDGNEEENYFKVLYDLTNQ